MSAVRRVVNWNIVGGCNYRCSYCVQKHAPGIGGPDAGRLARGLDALAALPGRWEFKISGGEPFLLKGLPDVAARLANAGHTVSVLTNLSAPLHVLERFIDAAGTQLRTFSCSLHVEEVDEDAFLERAIAVRERLAWLARASFVVNCVVRPGHVDDAAASRRRFEAAGIKFYPQLMRIDGRPAEYTPEDHASIERHFGDLSLPTQMNRGFALKGMMCHAGSRYFIVNPKGDAYTCYPGKRFGEGRLGNIYDGTLRLLDAPAPCRYDVCPCTVPQNRGIIETSVRRVLVLQG